MERDRSATEARHGEACRGIVRRISDVRLRHALHRHLLCPPSRSSRDRGDNACVEPSAIVAYTGAPAVALGAARMVKGNPQPDGFRVVDASGRVVLNYVDRARG